MRYTFDSKLPSQKQTRVRDDTTLKEAFSVLFGMLSSFVAKIFYPQYGAVVLRGGQDFRVHGARKSFGGEIGRKEEVFLRAGSS
jgi:hypothetical protein